MGLSCLSRSARTGGREGHGVAPGHAPSTRLRKSVSNHVQSGSGQELGAFSGLSFHFRSHIRYLLRDLAVSQREEFKGRDGHYLRKGRV